MTNYDVVKKLVGEINPIGESNTDRQRLENLKAMTELVEKLLADIDDLAYNYKNRKESSVEIACEFANKFLDKIGIVQ